MRCCQNWEDILISGYYSSATIGLWLLMFCPATPPHRAVWRTNGFPKLDQERSGTSVQSPPHTLTIRTFSFSTTMQAHKTRATVSWRTEDTSLVPATGQFDIAPQNKGCWSVSWRSEDQGFVPPNGHTDTAPQNKGCRLVSWRTENPSLNCPTHRTAGHCTTEQGL